MAPEHRTVLATAPLVGLYVAPASAGQVDCANAATPSKRTRTGRGKSLHLAWRRAGKLAYAGSVELGIDDATALDMRKAPDPLARTRLPLPAPIKLAFLNAGQGRQAAVPEVQRVA